ncbi:MAG TPA: flavin reductase family protein [Gemmatimonadaceae bacterium]|nr:flavin reductase family protein [Gemmatimonadaceae bacterium]
MPIGSDEFRAVLGRFASGVTVLTVRKPDGEDHGMTASAFCSVSLMPPLVLACIEHNTEMHGLIQTAEHFGVNILEESQEALSRRFAELPAGRFDGLGYTRAESGVVLLDDALAQMECRVVTRHEAGDHLIVVGEVDWAEVQSGRPLLYYRGGYAQLER